MYVFHENDIAKKVLVALPSESVFQVANAHSQDCLFESPVDYRLVREQHHYLTESLKATGIDVIDIMNYIKEEDYVRNDDLDNILFMRDSMLTTPKGIVMGNFREPIRRKEKYIVAKVLQENLGLNVVGSVESSEFQDRYVEGGDFFPAYNQCFIATGVRTNLAGVKYMMDNDLIGFDRVCVVRADKYPGNILNNMTTIHLDCYFGIVGHRHAILWNAVKDLLTVDIYHRGQLVCEGQLFVDYLKDQGYDMIFVSTEQQRKYACNLLYLGNNIVLSQEESISTTLKEYGYDVRYIKFNEIHKMYGGIRCATQVIWRDNI